MPSFEWLRDQNQWIWWNPELVEALEPKHFDLAAWQASGETSPSAGRGSACRIQQGGVDWFLRHYRRGGLIGKLLHDQYLWTGAAKTRVVQEINITHQLEQMGLPAPKVVGGRLLRSGLLYRADLITEALPCESSMADALSALTTAQWQAIGRCVGEFHKQGLWHADLNAHNIQLAGEKVWVIDFDRAQFKAPTTAWQQANIDRLWRSVCKISGGAENAPQSSWAQLLNAYNNTVTA